MLEAVLKPVWFCVLSWAESQYPHHSAIFKQCCLTKNDIHIAADIILKCWCHNKNNRRVCHFINIYFNWIKTQHVLRIYRSDYTHVYIFIKHTPLTYISETILAQLVTWELKLVLQVQSVEWRAVYRLTAGQRRSHSVPSSGSGKAETTLGHHSQTSNSGQVQIWEESRINPLQPTSRG